jgi:hypothetical protein
MRAPSIKRYDQFVAMNNWNATVVNKGGTDAGLPSPTSFASHPLPPRTTATLLRNIVAAAVAQGGAGLAASDVPTIVDDRRFGELKASIDALIGSIP